MKRTIALFLLGILVALGFSGCYIYTTEPPPQPAIVILPPGQTVVTPQQPQTPEPPPAPVGPPSGYVGPPRP